ncbi:putative arsenate reductase [Rosellinia necatrix]|uniref:Putative arsenate reductase n=1 Tax=Rosellinia necatrix TaxID=77044 RepID=A0A1S7ULR4_ROSNE|nr:putative arsenate reductase [Rosellinia necatrix]
MKLNSFLLPALAGVAAADSAAAPQHAEAYMLRHTKQTTSSSPPPSIPDSLAEAILLQRLSSPGQPSALGQIPQSLGDDEAISYINQFAKPTRPLFDGEGADAPKQLVIAFSGVTPTQNKKLKAAMPRVPIAFTAPGLGRLPAKVSSRCTFASSINPKAESSRCWSGETQYLQYDVTKNGNMIKELGANLAALESYANAGLMETTIVFLDGSSPSSDSDELRRRQLQFQKGRVTTGSASDTTFVSSTHKSGGEKAFDAFAGRPTTVPYCYASQNACETATSSCSGHGECRDRWAKDNTDNSCFYCQCKKTIEEDDRGHTRLYSWGGATCQKQDISTTFWLFAGVTIALVATVAFSIGLLFTVGEEKLPGVIGAGVSRSK